MMKFFKADLLKDKIKDVFKGDVLKESIKSIADPLKALAKNAKDALKGDEKENQLSDIIFIYPRVFWMTFPTKEKIKDLSSCLNTQFKKENYHIWNVSEHSYDTAYFNRQVTENLFVGYPCPPTESIFLIVKSILEWLSSDKSHIAIIHCQSTKGRSAIIISCLLSVLKVVNHPMEALTYFCNKLQLNDSSFLLPSQTIALKTFANLMDKIKLNKKKVILERIVISEPVKVIDTNNKGKDDKKAEPFRPYIQIFKGDKPIYNYLSKEKPKEYSVETDTIDFPIGVEFNSDLLIRCRHFRTNEERISIFRILMNPFFTFDENIKISKRDIDFSPEAETSSNFFIELVLKQEEDENPEAEILEKLRNECQEMSENLKKKKEVPKKEIEVNSEEHKNKFDIDEPSEEENENNTNDHQDSEKADLPKEETQKIEKIIDSMNEKEAEEGDEEEVDDYISQLEKKMES